MVIAQLYKVVLVLAIHVYVFWNVSSVPFKVNKLNVIGSILGTTMICPVLFYVRVSNSQPGRILFYSFMLWFTILFIAFMSSFVFQMLELMGLISDKNKPILILITTLLLVAYGITNASIIRVSHKTIYFKDHPLNSTIRIAHLTDLHFGSAYRKSFTESICNKLRELNPDLIAITGDLFDGNIEFEYELIEPFDHLGIPVYFVTGNHDQLYPKEITKVIERSKMIRLKDSTAVFNEIQLIGFDNQYPPPNIYNKMSEITLEPNKLNILLYHAPVFDTDLLSEVNIALHLAGHTHGGQVFPVNIFLMLISDYVSGLYHSEDYVAYIHVSPGLGTTKAQIRIGTSPTISLLTLSNKQP